MLERAYYTERPDAVVYRELPGGGAAVWLRMNVVEETVEEGEVRWAADEAYMETDASPGEIEAAFEVWFTVAAAWRCRRATGKWAVLIGGVPRYAPGVITEGGRVHYHPTEEVYRAAGWLPVYVEDAPGEEGVNYAEAWREEDGAIVCGWAEAEVPAPAPVGLSLADEVAVLRAENAALREQMDVTMGVIDAILMGEV